MRQKKIVGQQISANNFSGKKYSAKTIFGQIKLGEMNELYYNSFLFGIIKF